ncbi:TetR/AcrR family transcriptional regulator [Streptomyces lavendulae]|uniref:TetR/AcrR family transcriptional regulator n=1 Tax=Streptomyces lavendulae TaxID=1914 RepID=UPI0031E6A111
MSYHFGSLKALCDLAIEQALEHYLDAQIRELDALAGTATLSELAGAFARPMMSALTAGGRDLAVIRTVARVGIDPPGGWDRLAGKFEQARRQAVRVLAARLPGTDKHELVFRVRCAAGMLNWLALAPIGAELAAEPAERVERMLVPVVAGAFRGAS